MNRYRVEDAGHSFFNVTDTQTNDVQQINFDWQGTNQSATATWQYAPLDEQWEVDPKKYNIFRNRLHSDQQFAETQYVMNKRHDVWSDTIRDTATTCGGLQLRTGTGTFRGTTWITSDVTNGAWFKAKPEFPWIARHCPILWRLDRVVLSPVGSRIKKFTKWLLPNKSGEEIEQEYREKKSMELVEKWLNPDEFKKLNKEKQIEIVNKYDTDEIFIVSRNPNSTVKVKRNGKIVKDYCLVPSEHGHAGGDILLTKIMWLKTNPDEFKDVAIAGMVH